MNSLSQNVANKPLTCNALAVGNALRKMAQNYKRPDYSLILCREVYQAIKEDRPHKLKSEVLGILHHTAEIEKKLTETPKLHRGKVDVKDLRSFYGPELNQKIAEVNEWCRRERGNYTTIAKISGTNLTTLKRGMLYQVKVTTRFIERAHKAVQGCIFKATNGANPLYGTHKNEEFFCWLLSLYVPEIVDQAFFDMTKRDITRWKDGYKVLDNEWLVMENQVHSILPHSRLYLSEQLCKKGFITLHNEFRSGGFRRFKLSDRAHTLELYKLAFEAVKPIVAAGNRNKKFKFSSTQQGKVITENLLRISRHHFGLTK